MKHILIFLQAFFFLFSFLWSMTYAVSNQDLLRDVTAWAREEGVIVDKEAKDVVNDSWWFNLDLTKTPEEMLAFENRDSIFVKATRFLLRISILAAIPMVLYSGIKIILSLWDEGKLKQTLIELWHVAIWILLALLAVMIIYVVTSLTRGTLEANII